jgi:hypothetical protein
MSNLPQLAFLLVLAVSNVHFASLPPHKFALAGPMSSTDITSLFSIRSSSCSARFLSKSLPSLPGHRPTFSDEGCWLVRLICAKQHSPKHRVVPRVPLSALFSHIYSRLVWLWSTQKYCGHGWFNSVLSTRDSTLQQETFPVLNGPGVLDKREKMNPDSYKMVEFFSGGVF